MTFRVHFCARKGDWRGRSAYLDVREFRGALAHLGIYKAIYRRELAHFGAFIRVFIAASGAAQQKNDGDPAGVAPRFGKTVAVATFGDLSVLTEIIGDFARIDQVRTQLWTAPPSSYIYAPTDWIRFANDSYELFVTVIACLSKHA